jgi:hypothetical protein
MNYNAKSGGNTRGAEKALMASFATLPGAETTTEKSVEIPDHYENYTLKDVWPMLDAETQAKVARTIVASPKPMKPQPGTPDSEADETMPPDEGEQEEA